MKPVLDPNAPGLDPLMTPWSAFCAFSTLVLLLMYHLHLLDRLRAKPHSTVIGITIAARKEWISVAVEQGGAILAVQTLRNWLMSTTLLASTAAVTSIGLLGFVAQQSKGGDDPEPPTTTGFAADPVVRKTKLIVVELAGCLDGWKIILLILSFLCAFFCFTQSLRLFNHVAILIAVLPKKPKTPAAPAISLAPAPKSSQADLLAPSASPPQGDWPSAASDTSTNADAEVFQDSVSSRSSGSSATVVASVTTPLLQKRAVGAGGRSGTAGASPRGGGGGRNGRTTTTGAMEVGGERAARSRADAELLAKVTPEFVAELFNRGAMFHTLGIRFFYLIFPLAAWFFSDLTMLLTAVTLVVILQYVDTVEDSLAG
ncbi:hypothetical protein HDU96_001779 [Phlyctochytrium bullatum]|nr:hypothetical protein HDU96_001779 [Phlyctochytrium bullatum]